MSKKDTVMEELRGIKEDAAEVEKGREEMRDKRQAIERQLREAKVSGCSLNGRDGVGVSS